MIPDREAKHTLAVCYGNLIVNLTRAPTLWPKEGSSSSVAPAARSHNIGDPSRPRGPDDATPKRMEFSEGTPISLLSNEPVISPYLTFLRFDSRGRPVRDCASKSDPSIPW